MTFLYQEIFRDLTKATPETLFTSNRRLSNKAEDMLKNMIVSVGDDNAKRNFYTKLFSKIGISGVFGRFRDITPQDIRDALGVYMKPNYDTKTRGERPFILEEPIQSYIKKFVDENSSEKTLTLSKSAWRFVPFTKEFYAAKAIINDPQYSASTNDSHSPDTSMTTNKTRRPRGK